MEAFEDFRTAHRETPAALRRALSAGDTAALRAETHTLNEDAGFLYTATRHNLHISLPLPPGEGRGEGEIQTLRSCPVAVYIEPVCEAADDLEDACAYHDDQSDATLEELTTALIRALEALFAA